MAQYPKAELTNIGHDLIGESIVNKKALIFTKVILGDGETSEVQNISTMTALINPQMSLPLTKGLQDGGKTKLRFVVGNSNLETEFFAREVGIYAKVGEDGTEQLYAYTNGGNYVDYVPDKNNPIDAQIMDVYVITSNAETVQIAIDNSAYVTVLDLADHNADANAHAGMIAAHNADQNAHGGLLKLFVPLLGAVMKGILYLVDPADDSNDNQGATTGWTRRVFSTLLQKAFDATGVQYNLAQNGFVKFGSLLGGLCIQWGTTRAISVGASIIVPLPLSYNQNYKIVGTPNGVSTNALSGSIGIQKAVNQFAVFNWGQIAMSEGIDFIAIGK